MWPNFTWGAKRPSEQWPTRRWSCGLDQVSVWCPEHQWIKLPERIWDAAACRAHRSLQMHSAYLGTGVLCCSSKSAMHVFNCFSWVDLKCVEQWGQSHHCWCGPCSIRGFTGTDQEWREEFDLLRQECTQAASQGDNDGESLVGDSIMCLGPTVSIVSVFWEGQFFIDVSFIFVAWLQLDQPKTRVISSCVHDFFPHVFKPTAVGNF